MTQEDRLATQMAYIKIKDALDAVTRIKEKDTVLANVQRTLYRIEDTVWQYITPSKEGKK